MHVQLLPQCHDAAASIHTQTPPPTPQLRVAKLSLAGRGGLWSKLTCKRGAPYTDITVHLKLTPLDPLAPVDVRFRCVARGGVWSVR